MIVPQLKKDTARHFYSYLFLRNIYSLSQDKLKYKRKNDELIEQNKTRRSYWWSRWRKRRINLNALAMAPGACEGEKAGKYGSGTA